MRNPLFRTEARRLPKRLSLFCSDGEGLYQERKANKNKEIRATRHLGIEDNHMSKRERVIQTLEHEEPERIPIDFGGVGCTGMQARAYSELLDYLGIKEEIIIQDTFGWIALPSEQVLNWVDASCVDLSVKHSPEESIGERLKKYSDPDGNEYTIPKDIKIEHDDEKNEYILDDSKPMLKRVPTSEYFDDFPVEYHPLQEVDDLTELRELPSSAYSLSHRPEFATLEDLKNRAEWYYKNTKYALGYSFRASLFSEPLHLRGFEQFMRDFKRNPDFVRAIEERLLEQYKKNFDKVADVLEDFVQVITIYDDFGGQSSLLISPRDFEDLILPYMKEIYQYIKEKSDCYICLHSDGNVRALIDDFIEVGVDALNPIQVSIKDMDPKDLKEEYGDEITFWGGGCDTQDVLPNASPEKVKKHVKEMCEILAPGGGFVFSQVHNIQPGVPAENIEAMYQGVREFQTS